MAKPRFSPTLIFLSPWLLTLGLFWFYPLAYSFYLSLTKYNILNRQADFVGLANYLQVFSDPDFWMALKNTSFFVLGTIPFTTILALFVAILVNQKLPFKGLFRAGRGMRGPVCSGLWLSEGQETA